MDHDEGDLNLPSYLDCFNFVDDDSILDEPPLQLEESSILQVEETDGDDLHEVIEEENDASSETKKWNDDETVPRLMIQWS